MARRTLSQEVQDGILNGLRNNVSPATLAGQFGVSIPTVYNYRKQLNVAATTTVVPETTNTVVNAVPATAATRSARKSNKVTR